LPSFILQKNLDLIGFFKIKLRHPDGLKKTQIWVKKNSNGSPDSDHVTSGHGAFLQNCINWNRIPTLTIYPASPHPQTADTQASEDSIASPNISRLLIGTFIFHTITALFKE